MEKSLDMPSLYSINVKAVRVADHTDYYFRVYENLEGHEHNKIFHSTEIGKFKIEQRGEMSAERFLEKIRENLEEIIQKES